MKANRETKIKSSVVLILGSGFHKQVIGADNPISDWGNLIHSLGLPKKEITGNFILDFERLIVRKSSAQKSLSASEIESELLEQTERIISKAQIRALKSKAYEPFKWLFTSGVVSDVISLNFDLIPEYFLSPQKLPRAKFIKMGGAAEQVTRYRYFKKYGITFWHIHGDIEHTDSLMLSLRRYGLRLAACEVLRKRFKLNQRNRKKDYTKTWYDQIMEKEVFIVGAGFSANEWDLWFSMVNRERNFGRITRKTKQPAVYQMGVKLPDIFFAGKLEPDFNDQWEKLKLNFGIRAQGIK